VRHETQRGKNREGEEPQPIMGVTARGSGGEAAHRRGRDIAGQQLVKSVDQARRAVPTWFILRIGPFDPVAAGTLIVATFLIVWVAGYIFAVIWN
jgi:hypothetical protein